MAEFPRVMIQSRSFPVAAVLLVISLLFTRSDALTKPDTSLKTLPVAYFGGVAVHPRAQASYDMLAKMRIVVIEKWEGPCWDLCLANVSKGLQCQPSCHGEFYMMDTLQRVKKANPSVATGYYQNTLYMWRYQSLYGDFAAHDECLRALNGSIAGIVNDGGMQNVPVFSLDKNDTVFRYVDLLRNLTETGFIDGTFTDKPPILAFQNETTRVWQVCEKIRGSGAHEWIHACIPISESVAMAYNDGKHAVLNQTEDVFLPKGGFILAGSHVGNMRLTNFRTIANISDLLARLAHARTEENVKYIYISVGDDDRPTDGKNVSSQCTEQQIAMFLITVEEGMFLGCNGWSDDFSKPLGNPLANATQAGMTWSRKFSSGTSLTYDEQSGSVNIHWSSW
eukprot:scpid79209/ scgid35185/ 